MRVVVTGAYGQLGREICRQLGAAAVPSDVDTLDITKGPLVRETLTRLRPDAVINCAAYTQVDQAEHERNRCRLVNAGGVEHLANACVEPDCPLVQISTDHVFHGPADRSRPYREDETPSPQGVYAETKLEGEQAAARHAKHLIVRTSGLYARPSDGYAQNFVRTMLRLGSRRRRLSVVSDQRCTPSYVPHVARAVLFLVGAGGRGPAPWGVYHVTNCGETTWYEFAREIFRQAGMRVSVSPITTAEYGPAAPRPAYSVLDTQKYHALGGPEMPHWREGLRDYFS